LLAVLAIIAGFLPVVDAPAATGTIVATQSVNIRACAALDCDVIGAAQLGDSIEVTGNKVNGFYPVTWFGREGFAFALYVNPGGLAPWLVEGDTACKRVALTFNIGIGYTPSQSVLSTLTTKGAKATMFPMGWWAERGSAYLRQLDAAGFVIGTHGDQARFLTDQTDALIQQDTSDSITAIETVLGHPIDPYHTPYAADTDNRVRTVVSAMGLLPVGWRIAANDYASTATESDVYNRVMGSMYPGAVVEFHLDGPATEQSTARALPRIIDALRAQGYQLVTVPEMVIPCSTSLPTTPAFGTVVNTGGTGLRCRMAPNTTAGIITVLPDGTRLAVRSPVSDGWVPVTCANQSGWVSNQYFRLDSTTPTPTPTPPPTPSPTTPPSGTTYGTVTNTSGDSLRCRTTPSTSGAIITSLAPGTQVVVRGAKLNGWWPVVCGGRDGWVSATYLTVSSGTTPTPTPPPTGSTGTVSGTGGAALRCRTGPGTSYAIITSLAPGTQVAIRGPASGGWTPVVCGGRNGFVSSQYLTIN
jgi:peptidoglycan/xylan/chitin deacetylase (PgdA/CDA1 family)/uncharacterized protein YraI